MQEESGGGRIAVIAICAVVVLLGLGIPMGWFVGIGEKIAAIPPMSGVLLLLAVVLGYFCRPILRRLPFLPEDKFDTAVIISKGLALACALGAMLIALIQM